MDKTSRIVLQPTQCFFPRPHPTVKQNLQNNQVVSFAKCMIEWPNLTEANWIAHQQAKMDSFVVFEHIRGGNEIFTKNKIPSKCYFDVRNL